jgi:hypothetical protein
VKRADKWMMILAALISGLVGGGLVNFWQAGATAKGLDHIKARSLIIVDQSGKERLYIGVPSHGAAVIQAMHRAGKAGIVLYSGNEGNTNLGFLDKNGEFGLTMGLDSHGFPSLTMFTQEGIQGINIEVATGLLPRLGLYGTKRHDPEILVRNAANFLKFKAP